jgi:hypothetical protein
MFTKTMRGLLSCLLVGTLVGSTMAVDSGAAMLYTNGTAWINGSHVPKTMAVFSGDLVQTKSDSLANIKASGINVLVLSDSLVQFDPAAIKLEHGRVNVVTTKGLAVRVGSLKVVPASTSSSTEFEVTDTDGTAKIVARKGDLTVDDGKTSTTLAQGQETSRDQEPSQKSKDRRRAGGVVPGATGGILDSPYAIAAGAAAIGGLTTWVLLKGDDPVSPRDP